MPYVPEEIVTEILLRLPVKCLMKCLFVCKDWYGLIKSAHFVDLHLNNPSTIKNRREHMISGGIRYQRNTISYYSYDNINGAFLPMPAPLHLHELERIMVCGPCNGIICIVPAETYGQIESIILCNPATRESRGLPIPPSHIPFRCALTTACGLGYDPSTNEYKVFSSFFCKFEDGGEKESEFVHRIGIYNLSSNSWKEVETDFPDSLGRHSLSGGGLLSNGRLHWICNVDEEVVIWFDIANETFGQVLLPPNFVPGTNQRVVVLEDCLALAVVDFKSGLSAVETCSIFIWKMMDCGGKESWVKRFSISLPFPGTSLHPVSFFKDDGVLLLVEKSYSNLISVSLGKVDGWRVKPQKSFDACFWRDFIMLKESLVSVR